MGSTQSKYASRLPLWVILGAALGVFCGLFFGEGAALLRPIGSVYVKLMEVAVFPYIISALLHGLGRLTPQTAWRLFRCSWLVYLVLWGCTFAVILLLASAIPPSPPPSAIDASQPEAGAGLLQLLIPANPFMDLAKNYVPAVVIFSLLYGVAIQRVQKKEAFLSVLELVRGASVVIWRWVVLLAPIGVFALFADTASTLKPGSMIDLSLYFVLIFSGTLLLAFWILPSIIAALCPMATGEVLRALQQALVIAVVTSLSVAALPFIQQAAEKLAERMDIKDDNRGEIIETTLAVSYPLAQVGNYFILLFVLFCAFYYRTQLGFDDQMVLPFVALLSGIGSPSSSIDAVAFLAEWLGLPTDSTDLYLGLLTVTRYGQVVASVMGFAFVTFLVTLNYYGRLRLRLPRLGIALLVSAGLLAIIIPFGHFIESDGIAQGVANYPAYQLSREATAGVSVTIETSSTASAPVAPPSDSGESIMDRIQRSGEIKVGYNRNIIPFSYENDQGQLVGYDIVYAYQLARDLNVALRLIPFTWHSLSEDLKNQRFDMAASGIYVTDDRLQQFSASDPYLQSPVALIVRSDRVESFLSRTAIEALGPLRIAVFDDPIMVALGKRLFPQSKIVVLPSYQELPNHPNIDAAIWTLAQAKAWATPRADYTAVVPRDVGGPFLIAYLLPEGSSRFTQFLNYWMALQRTNGFHDRQKRHWIEGKPDAKQTSRWSIMRNVLGWGS